MASRSEKLLIFDDDYLIRSLLKTLLDLYNFESVFAVDGKHAVKKWEQENFCAILMDIDMPVMDGFAATKEIRQREKEEGRVYTPIIGVSGGNYSEGGMQYADAGMDGFVTKPFTQEDLMISLSPFIQVPEQ
jgi:CheY-like chemotaxis protein